MFRSLIYLALVLGVHCTAKAQHTIAWEFPAAYFWGSNEALTFDNPIYNLPAQNFSYTYQRKKLGVRIGLDHFYKQYYSGRDWDRMPMYAAYEREYANLNLDVLYRLYQSKYLNIDAMLGPTIKLQSADYRMIALFYGHHPFIRSELNSLEFGAHGGILISYAITPRFTIRALAQHTFMFNTPYQKHVSGGSLGVGYSFGRDYRLK